MGKQHCICQEEPCRCNNGWGFFKTEEELLSAISAEIRAEECRLAEPVVGRRDLAIGWMLDEGYDPSEVADELGVSVAHVRRIARTLNDP